MMSQWKKKKIEIRIRFRNTTEISSSTARNFHVRIEQGNFRSLQF